MTKTIQRTAAEAQLLHKFMEQTKQFRVAADEAQKITNVLATAYTVGLCPDGSRVLSADPETGMVTVEEPEPDAPSA